MNRMRKMTYYIIAREMIFRKNKDLIKKKSCTFWQIAAARCLKLLRGCLSTGGLSLARFRKLVGYYVCPPNRGGKFALRPILTPLRNFSHEQS